MNDERLKLTLEHYKAVFPSRWNEEKYKWEAIWHFQNYWEISAANFTEMFSLTT